MQRRWAGVGTSASPFLLAGMMACGGGTAMSPPGGPSTLVDASADDAPADGGSNAGDGGGGACTPLGVDAGSLPPFTSPAAPQSVCTPSQILAYYNACYTGAGGTTCSDFEGDPANSPCILCVLTPSTNLLWGPVVNFRSVAISFTNVSGCIETVDGFSGPGSCADAVQSLLACELASCGGTCPNGSTAAGLAAFTTCQTLSRATTCSGYAQAATCQQASKYSACEFVTFQAGFRGLGQTFCAAGVDGGASGEGGASDDASGE